MRETITKCDNCGRVRGETNHWPQVIVTPQGFYVPAKPTVLCEDGTSYDLCGHECLQKLLAKWFAGGLK